MNQPPGLPVDLATCSRETRRWVLSLADKIAELQAIVDKLPKTADGVPIVPEQDVYFYSHDMLRHGVVLSITRGADFCKCLIDDDYDVTHTLDTEDLYSTRKAIEAKWLEQVAVGEEAGS